MEQGLDAAKREFNEETSVPAPQDDYIPLKPVTQKSEKIVHAWAVEGEFDAENGRPGLAGCSPSRKLIKKRGYGCKPPWKKSTRDRSA